MFVGTCHCCPQLHWERITEAPRGSPPGPHLCGPRLCGPLSSASFHDASHHCQSNGFAELCESILNRKVVLRSPQTCWHQKGSSPGLLSGIPFQAHTCCIASLPEAFFLERIFAGAPSSGRKSESIYSIYLLEASPPPRECHTPWAP